MFKKIAIAVVVLLAAVFGYAATQPDTFHVERRVEVAAAPERILPLVSDFRLWRTWSPWEELDPQLQRTYTRAKSGTGAVYEWSGNSDAGSGRMQILSVTSSAVTIKLDFTAPFESSNTTAFAFEPSGAGTQVIWSMDGPMPYASKLMSVFASMDQFIGKDFEAGLTQLKAAAEKPASPVAFENQY
jgi:hypothetical protein